MKEWTTVLQNDAGTWTSAVVPWTSLDKSIKLHLRITGMINLTNNLLDPMITLDLLAK
jgi:hypothetical protein